MVGLPFTKEEVETRQPLDFAPVNPADFAPADDSAGADIGQDVRPAQAGAKAAAVAKKIEEVHKSELLDSYSRNETGGHYDCWVYSTNKGENYVACGEGAKRLMVVKQPAFDCDPSVKRIDDRYHRSLTCVSKILRGRGAEGCGYRMDKDGYMDLEDLGFALRKELRHPIPWNMQKTWLFSSFSRSKGLLPLVARTQAGAEMFLALTGCSI